ncbi:sugar transferase [Thermotoga sp. KOL6]|uniref:sugar transferase n=1 Tax=Thermotoga sp. KOL6 TaxID=126741 RepID=UPI000C75653F|nr:sugar transferase [Thermotoga sp. KOL6]PLV59337.1 polyprenyl glycosylphosphotransferase [Thermotoga sp. KOL6]
MNSIILLDFLLVFSLNLLFFNWYIAFLFSCSMILSFFAFRLYDPENLQSYNEQLVRAAVGVLFSFVPIFFFYPLFGNTISHYNFLGNFLIASLLIPPFNFLFSKLFTRSVSSKNVLVLGKKEEVEHILEEIEKKTFGKYRFADYLNPSLETLKAHVKEYDLVLITDPDFEDIAKNSGAKNIEYLPNLVERTLKRIPVEVIEKFEEYYKVVFDSVRDDSPAKRILDVFISIVALVVFSPIMLIVAIMIYLEDGRPIIFRQERVGKNEETFTMIKFRSMKKTRTNQPKFADQEKDRILKVGKIIRPFRLDEVLQFVHVLRGEMSVVGPRPEQVDFVKMFKRNIPFYYLRHKVKPGITGWAQLMYKYSSNLEEAKQKLSYDLWYIKNRNILLDLRIVLQTIEAVLWRRGAR